MAAIYMDVNAQSANQNQFYQTRAAVWLEDNKEVRAVYYHIGRTTTAEVWENQTCISIDLAYAMAYLRGAGFKDKPTFETFCDYDSIIGEIDDSFAEARSKAMEEQEKKEMPF